MIDGPHIFGFSPVALCINLTSALASARLVWSVRASINVATLSWLAWFCCPPSSCLPSLPQTNPGSRSAAHHYTHSMTGPQATSGLLPHDPADGVVLQLDVLRVPQIGEHVARRHIADTTLPVVVRPASRSRGAITLISETVFVYGFQEEELQGPCRNSCSAARR